jgi:hypothetical protein
MLLTKVFADEFMGDLLNRRSLLPCTKRQLSESLHPVFLPSHHISSLGYTCQAENEKIVSFAPGDKFLPLPLDVTPKPDLQLVQIVADQGRDLLFIDV